jgi:phage gp46-like protein
MTTRYNGDPKITLDENGANLHFHGGQPEMDSGLENAPLISLHTEKGYWGNTLFAKSEQKLGSQYLEEVQKPISLDQINRIRNAAEFDLAWMVETNVANSVTANTTNPVSKNIQTTIFIEPPSRDPTILVLTKAGLNWISQKLDPAYKRV